MVEKGKLRLVAGYYGSRKPISEEFEASRRTHFDDTEQALLFW